jgi:hypothetical protein
MEHLIQRFDMFEELMRETEELDYEYEDYDYDDYNDLDYGYDYY